MRPRIQGFAGGRGWCELRVVGGQLLHWPRCPLFSEGMSAKPTRFGNCEKASHLAGRSIPRLVKGDSGRVESDQSFQTVLADGPRRRARRCPRFETAPPPRASLPFPSRCAEAHPAREAAKAICGPLATPWPRREGTADRGHRRHSVRRSVPLSELWRSEEHTSELQSRQ